MALASVKVFVHSRVISQFQLKNNVSIDTG